MSEPVRRKRNPYVGPRAFRKDELFFGREAETEGLLNKLLPSGVLLLHSPSGAGKTSLIQAVIVPELLDQGFQICASTAPRFSALRVNLPPPENVEVANRYVFSVVNGIVGLLVDRTEAARMTIAAALDLFERQAPRGGEPDDGPAGSDGPQPERPQQVVIIDQLEEVLTLDRNDTAGQAEFFRQLGSALRRGRRWALLSMREDHLGGLDKYKRFFQNELRATYRLDYLDEASALRAVQRPAAEYGVDFQETAARQLIADLRGVRADSVPDLPPADHATTRAWKPAGRSIRALGRTESNSRGGLVTAGRAARSGAHRQDPRTPEGAGQVTRSAPETARVEPDEPVVYPYVEPVLLQVLCDSLWRILSKNSASFTEITEADLGKVKPYSTTLSKYYRHVVREAAGRDDETERAIRDWVEQHLVTKEGLRRPTRALPKVAAAAQQEVMDKLQHRYLIRDDPRPGGAWWELSHDQLVQPAIDDNRAWRLANLPAWQVVADEWQRTGRPRDLLLSGPDLRDARSAARKLQLTLAESDFLDESLRRAEEEGGRASLEFQRNFFRILMVLSVLLNLWLAYELWR